jgi:hypothetical protein
MGFVSWLLVEATTFELSVDEGGIIPLVGWEKKRASPCCIVGLRECCLA